MKDSKRVEEILKIYNDIDSPAAFQSPRKVYLYLKKKGWEVTLQEVKNALRSSRAYGIIRTKPKNFLRQRIVSDGWDDVWQGDLLEMPVDKQSLQYNKGTRYLLTLMDVLSRKVFIKPLKSKSSQVVTTAFESVLKETKRKPRKFHTDKGSEFYNKIMGSIYKKYGIKH